VLIPGDRSHSTTRRSGSGYGKGFSNRPLTTLNTALLAPMPIASEATMTAVRPALRRSVRMA
jgi:hypothetical protein